MTRAFARRLLTNFVALLFVLASQGASAHAQFRDSSPAADTSVNTSPHEIVLNFSQAVTPVTMVLVGPDGNVVETGSEAQGNGKRVVLAIGDTLVPGTYVVSFRVLSGDAHPISGGFRFSISGPDIDSTLSAEPDVTQPTASSFGASGDIAEPTLADASSLVLLEQVSRAVFIALALMAIGFVVFQALIPLPESLDTWLFGLARRVAWFGIIAAVGYFLVATFSIAGLDAFRLRHLYVVLQTSIGMSLLLAIVGFLFLTMSTAQQKILTGIGALLLVVSRVVTGHPASQEPSLLLIPGMAVHVAAAGFWLASLWVLLRLLRKGPLVDAPGILDGFAKAALWIISALVAAGVLMAAVHVQSIDGLSSTIYGNTLLWKLGGVAALLAFAMVNKFWLTPKLSENYAPSKLRTSIRLEASVMLVVIAISTVLAATPPVAKGDDRQTAGSTSVVRVMSESGDYIVAVDFSSQRYDETLPLSIELYDSGGDAIAAREASVTVTIPSRRIESLPLSISGIKGNHVIVEADFPDAADTSFEALILVSDFDREKFVFNREGRIEH